MIECTGRHALGNVMMMIMIMMMTLMMMTMMGILILISWGALRGAGGMGRGDWRELSENVL